MPKETRRLSLQQLKDQKGPDRISLDKLERIGELVSMNAWAASTSRQGAYAFARYCRVCKEQGWAAFPISEVTLYNYAVFRFATSDVTGPSFQTELYNLRQALLRFGVQIDISQKGPMLRLTTLMKGWKKIRGPKFKRKPITSKVLANFFEHIGTQHHDELLIRAALALAKFGMMRVSEYTHGPNSNCPKVGDIRLYPNAEDARYMALYFSKSKCNQHAHTERVICVCACPEPCAVHATIDMLSARDEVHPDDELFQFKGGKLLSPKIINGIIKELCTRCGLDPKAFTSHCLRKGGITDTLCTGVPDSIVQILSRHANLDSLRPYKLLSDESLGTILSAHLRTHRQAARDQYYRTSTTQGQARRRGPGPWAPRR